MKISTYLSIITTCESRKQSLVSSWGLKGIAVMGTPPARRWQHLDRISHKAQGRLLAVSAASQQRVAELEAALRPFAECWTSPKVSNPQYKHYRDAARVIGGKVA